MFSIFLILTVGKSSLLSAIENREIPIPEHVDIYHLRREMPPSEKTALQAVCDVDKERIKLEHESEVLATKDDQGMKYKKLSSNVSQPVHLSQKLFPVVLDFQTFLLAYMYLSK